MKLRTLPISVKTGHLSNYLPVWGSLTSPATHFKILLSIVLATKNEIVSSRNQWTSDLVPIAGTSLSFISLSSVYSGGNYTADMSKFSGSSISEYIPFNVKTTCIITPKDRYSTLLAAHDMALSYTAIYELVSRIHENAEIRYCGYQPRTSSPPRLGWRCSRSQPLRPSLWNRAS